MNYLAIDTSGSHLTVIAVKGERKSIFHEQNAGLQHSVRLMHAVARTMEEVELCGKDADFFVAVVGPGSFTGIRIGVATVKALAYAFQKPVKSVTSLDLAAYDKGSAEKTLALVDARHGHFYACTYDGRVAGKAEYLPESEVERLAEGYHPVCVGNCSRADFSSANLVEGLTFAAESKPLLADAEELVPLYVRKSQAEEGR